MASEMIERVAAVLLGRVNAPEQEIYSVARAIIEVMREPIEPMANKIGMAERIARAMFADVNGNAEWGSVGSEHIFLENARTAIKVMRPCALEAEIERLRAALKALHDGCVSLDPGQAVLPQQMQAARAVLSVGRDNG